MGLLAVALWGPTAAKAESPDAAKILDLLNAQDFDAARTLLRAQNPSAYEEALFEGRVLKVQGRYEEAIAAFRLAASLDPANLTARRELAHTLMLAGEYNRAEHHFDALLEIDPNENRQEGYRRFLTSIRENKPFGASGHFALLPSTNINRGTSNTIFDTESGSFVINPESQAASGIGLQLGVSGYARAVTSPQSRWTLGASLIGTKYKHQIHDTATAAVSLSYERGFKNGRVSAQPYVRYTWREDDADERAIGMSFGLNYRLEERTLLGLTAVHEKRRYPNQSYKDGPFSKLSFGLARNLDPSLVLRGSVSFELSRPNASHMQYDGYGLGVSLAKTWAGGLESLISLDAGVRDFQGVYPLTVSPRDDSFASLSVSVYNPRFNVRGLIPRLTCSVTANRSNIVFYDYNATECQVALSRNF